MERLRKLRLPTLEFRRFRGDLIETYKIMNIYNIRSEDFFTCLPPSSNVTRGNVMKISKPRVNTTLRSNSFSFRVIKNWNALPNEVVCAPSLNNEQLQESP